MNCVQSAVLLKDGPNPLLLMLLGCNNKKKKKTMSQHRQESRVVLPKYPSVQDTNCASKYLLRCFFDEERRKHGMIEEKATTRLSSQTFHGT
jgi:hypothetical protein